MKTIVHPRHTQTGSDAVHVSVLCCGRETEKIAVRTLSRIQRLLSEQSAACEFRAHWCFVAELFLDHRFSAAVNATSHADLIVVSFSAHEPLPLVMMHWMEHWVPSKRGEDAALIALLHGRTAAQHFSPVENLLRSAAHSTGLTLFVQHFRGEHRCALPQVHRDTPIHSAESRAAKCDLQPLS